MSPKLCTRRLARWLHSHRHYHSSVKVLNYHPKVSAIPFAISPEEAIYQSALKACFLVDNYTALMQAVLSRFFPTIYEPPRPLKIEPVYLPTWLVDAEVTAKISDHTANSTIQTQATAQSLSTYLPGFDHFPLSVPKFRFKKRILHSPLDEGFGLLPSSKQRITCLPYTRSPFTLPEAVRSMSFEQCKIDSTLKVERDSIHFPLLAPAYPVLFPVYLMQWEGFDAPLEGKPRIFSMILDAHEPYGILYMEGYLRSSIKTPQVDTGFWKIWSPNMLMLSLNRGWEEGAAVYEKGDMCMHVLGGFSRPRSKHSVIHLDKMASIPRIDKRVDKWLDRQLLSRELQLAPSTALPKEVINWDDVRIRRLSPEEEARNTKYWSMRMQATAARSMHWKDLVLHADHSHFQMKAINDSKNSMVVTVGSSGMRAGKGEEMQQRMQVELTKIERLMEESKPQWLKIAEQQTDMPEV